MAILNEGYSGNDVEDGECRLLTAEAKLIVIGATLARLCTVPEEE